MSLFDDPKRWIIKALYADGWREIGRAQNDREASRIAAEESRKPGCWGTQTKDTLSHE